MLKRIQKTILNQLNKTILFISIMIMVLMCLVFTFIIKNYSYQIYQNLNTIPNINFAFISDLSSKYRFDQSSFFISTKANKNLWNNYLENTYNDFNTIANKDYISYGDINFETSQILFLENYSEEYGLLFQTSFSNISPNGENAKDEVKTNGLAIDLLKQGNIYGLSHNLIAIDKEDFLDKHYNYLNDLVEGRHLTQKEIEQGEYKIVLGARSFLYKDNKFRELHVGDNLVMSLFVKDNDLGYIAKEYEFEIVGIYDGYKDDSPYGSSSFYNYTSINCLNKIIKENEVLIEKSSCTNYACYLGPTYLTHGMLTINSINDISTFIQDFNQINDEDKNYSYETNADSYIDLAGRIEGVNESFNYLFIFSLITSILVLLFMIELDIFNRKQEIGILLSLGVSKKEICIQFIIEYLLKILIALIIVIIFAYSFSNIFLIKILDINDIDFAITNSMIQSINISTSYTLTIKDVFKILLLTILVTLPSVLIALFIILKANVKEILIYE